MLTEGKAKQAIADAAGPPWQPEDVDIYLDGRRWGLSGRTVLIVTEDGKVEGVQAGVTATAGYVQRALLVSCVDISAELPHERINASLQTRLEAAQKDRDTWQCMYNVALDRAIYFENACRARNDYALGSRQLMPGVVLCPWCQGDLKDEGHHGNCPEAEWPMSGPKAKVAHD